MRLLYGGPPRNGKRDTTAAILKEVKARMLVQRFFGASRDEMLKLSLADALELAKWIEEAEHG